MTYGPRIVSPAPAAWEMLPTTLAKLGQASLMRGYAVNKFLSEMDNALPKIIISGCNAMGP